MTNRRTGSRNIKCLRCGEIAEEVNCEVFHKDGSKKGVICSTCALRPAKLRSGLTSRARAGRPKGIRVRTRKKTNWLMDLREVFGDDRDRLETDET